MLSRKFSVLYKNISSRSVYNLTNSLYENGNKQNKQEYNKYDNGFFKKIIVGSTIVSFGYYLAETKKSVKCTETIKKNALSGVYVDGLPEYSFDEVAKHDRKDSRIWVTYKEGVYDITDFVDEHPGGDQILMAAGNSVEPFWVLYGVHVNPHVLEIFEKYRIGNLKESMSAELIKGMVDPYSNEPKRHSVLKPASQKPFNAETPPVLLIENFYTPNELFYVRNHLPVPDVDPKTYELEVEIEEQGKTVSFNLEDLKKMPKQTITATIMCAGNRRSEMTKIKPVKGLNWGIAAVGNATWTGVYLRDVLANAGISDNVENEYSHIQFEGLDFDATGKTYGASIPLWKAFDKRADILLAYEMNGVPIPRDHGFPLRVIVPGVVGARNVKWLAKIIVSKEESTSHWQQNDYKGFSPSTDWDTVDFTKSPAIQELPVISAICKPGDGQTVELVNGNVSVKGYAWSGGGQKIVRVDVTADGGKTWYIANLDHQDSVLPPRHWAWTLWSVNIPVHASQKQIEIWAKAVDSSYNTQPENFENIWNLRGVLSNAYHKIKINLKH